MYIFVLRNWSIQQLFIFLFTEEINKISVWVHPQHFQHLYVSKLATILSRLWISLTKVLDPTMKDEILIVDHFNERQWSFYQLIVRKKMVSAYKYPRAFKRFWFFPRRDLAKFRCSPSQVSSGVKRGCLSMGESWGESWMGQQNIPS